MHAEDAPDVSRGLFETLLVTGGRPVRLGAHLDRLASSLREIFGLDLPASLTAEVEAASRGLELGRMRIDLLPASDGLRHEIQAEPIDPAIFFPPRSRGADLRTVRPPHRSGAHKLADRRWLEGVEAELGEEVPLILGEAAEVLEAGRANVFAVVEGRLLTPPADGRILAGTARRALLDLAAELGVPVAERRLDLADLRGAEDVFLTSSLRGIRPVRSIDGVPREGGSELVDQLADALRERWLGEG